MVTGGKLLDVTRDKSSNSVFDINHVRDEYCLQNERQIRYTWNIDACNSYLCYSCFSIVVAKHYE